MRLWMVLGQGREGGERLLDGHWNPILKEKGMVLGNDDNTVSGAKQTPLVSACSGQSETEAKQKPLVWTMIHRFHVSPTTVIMHVEVSSRWVSCNNDREERVTWLYRCLAVCNVRTALLCLGRKCWSSACHNSKPNWASSVLQLIKRGHCWCSALHAYTQSSPTQSQAIGPSSIVLPTLTVSNTKITLEDTLHAPWNL